MLELFEVSNL